MRRKSTALLLFQGSCPLTGDLFLSVALTVQIRLTQNRTDLAQKEVQAAKKWANDSLLVNLAESWVNMRVVSANSSSMRNAQGRSIHSHMTIG